MHACRSTLEDPTTYDGVVVLGASNSVVGNVASGNGRFGIDVTGAAAFGNAVQGNFVGVAASGMAALPNGAAGIYLGAAARNLIGGTTAAARNVVSGNGQDGISVTGGGTTGNVLQGNFVGLNAAGTAALANNGDGIVIQSGAAGNGVYGNVASGNRLQGVELTGAGTTGNVVQGDLVGVNPTGNAALPNLMGVEIGGGASGNNVGGTTAGSGNVLSGNTLCGVVITGAGTAGNVVQGNFIGTGSNGTGALGNGSHGAFVTGQAAGNAVGSNVIANNAGNGVLVGSDPALGTAYSVAAGAGNSVLSNSMFGNARLALDLGANDGVTANDSKGHSGPNDWQNFPTLSAVTSGSSGTHVQGTLRAAASTTFRVEFFASPAADPSGHGQALAYLGFVTVTTDASGAGSFDTVLPALVSAGWSVSATATSPTGDTSELSSDLTASAAPVANAGPNQSGPEGSGITFAGSVTGGAAPFTYSWTFGDGGTATGTLTPSHAYQEPGAYTATLTVTDGQGRSSTASATATVSEVTPTASAGGPYSGAPGAAISFTGSATDAPADLAGMKYAWSFGDGGTSAVQSPSHAYAAAGTYTATLTVTDPDGLSASATASVTVTNGAPVANAGPNQSGPEGTSLTFAGSVTGGTAPLTYSWTFGDGGTATGTLTPSHAYQEAGTYTATLTVTDGQGRTSTASATATVSEVTPTASAGGPYSGTAGTAVSFSGSATDAPADLAGMKYAWSFGDGGTSAVQSPSHSYAAAGTYTATLTVTDPDGLSASATASVTVIAAPPVANAGPSKSGNEGTSLTFAGSVTGGTAPLTYSWTFGDGGSASGTLTPSHTYQDAGTFTVTLTVTDNLGRTSTATTGATANEVTPTASAGGPYSGAPAQTINFSGSATDAPADLAGMQYAWNFGDGSTSTGTGGGNTSHSYTAAGKYTATLTVTNPDGLTASATATVTIVAAPVANAGPSKSGNEGSSITFAGSVTGGQTPLTYSWAFGDGGTATGTLTPTHVYDDNGTYTATLTVTDAWNRTSTSTTTATVANVAPTPNAGGPYSGAPGAAISFTGSATDPSNADTKAGFKWLWNFGDGGTSAAQSPSHAYAAAGTYTATLTATDKDGGSASATATVTVGSSSISTLWLQNFDGPGLPLDGDGDPYPYELAPYNGGGGAEGGTATLSLDSADSATGSSLKAVLAANSNNFYLQFNPYNGANNPPNPNYPAGDSFARNYAQGAANWKFNYYTYLSFWVQLPNSEPDWMTDGPQQGDPNFNVGTYVKQVTNADPSSDEAGGNHYYHNLMLPTQVGGAWTHVVLNMHPDHVRGGGTQDYWADYPTTATFGNGGADPANTYNYFDTLTRFYIEDNSLLGSAAGFTGPQTYHLDDVQFLHDPYQENDQQVYSVTSTYQASANRLVLTWMHKLGEDSVNDEVRYSFTDIHQTGWAAATPAPNGIVSPPGSGGYNGSYYDNSTLPLAGHSVVYVAIKPQNSSVFTEIAVPLTGNVTL